MNIKTLFAAAILSGAALAGVSQASAMPFGAAPSAGVAIEQAAWGCGPGWHPGPYGRCVPNRRAFVRPMYRPRPFYRRHRW